MYIRRVAVTWLCVSACLGVCGFSAGFVAAATPLSSGVGAEPSGVGIESSGADGEPAAPQSAAGEVEEMLVSAARLPVPAAHSGRSVSVLDAAAIRDLGYPYALDLLRFVPGLAVHQAGGYGGQVQLRIRGAEANHTVVLIDGIDISAAGSGEFDLAALLSADIERIEVLRGPQSGVYGSNALGGVVNIQTRAPLAGLAAQAELEAGDNHTRQALLSVSGGRPQWQGRLSWIARESQFDVSRDDSLIGAERDRDENRTVAAQLWYAPTDALSVKLVGRHIDKQTDTDGFDFSGGPLQGLAVDDASYAQTRDSTLGLSANLAWADGRGLTRLSLARTESRLEGIGYGSDAARTDVQADLGWQWQASGPTRQQTTVYLQWEAENYENLEPFDPSQFGRQHRDIRGYGLEHRVDWADTWFLQVGLRRDHNDDFEDANSYNLSAAYQLPSGDTRLRASYGRGLTNPTFFEQFGFIPGSFQGNPALRPEQSRSWDVGVEQTWLQGRLRLDLGYFDADLSDEIQPLFPTVVNASADSQRQGVEASLYWRPTTTTSVAATYTYTDAREPEGAEVRRPRHLGSLSVAHSWLDERLRVALSVAYNGTMLDTDYRQYFADGFVARRSPLASFTLVNLQASYALAAALEVYVRVENLGDATYEQAISYASPGRALFAGLRYTPGG